jgi:predicted RNA-binding Zn-ribbon protein involved in translation (DUF1610 family)
MQTNYTCKNCGWTGSETELQFETVEGCFGDDTLEICPKCGSGYVFITKRY